MFLNSKKTRLAALFTLATTFVYYRYMAPSRDEQFHLQFTDSNEVSPDLAISSADVRQLLKDHPLGNQYEFQRNENSAQEQTGENDRSTQGENTGVSSNAGEIDDGERIANRDNGEQNQEQNREQKRTEQNQDTYSNRTQTQIREQDALGESQVEPVKKKAGVQDFIVVNNKVYHKDDVIPKKPNKFPVLSPSSGKFLMNIDLDEYSGKDKQFLKKRMKEMVKRTKKIAKVCSARSKLIVSEELNLIWDRNHSPNIVWCPQYKVASTSWTINFLRLAHFNEDNPVLQEMNPGKKKRLQFRVKYGAKQDAAYKLYPPPEDRTEFLKTFKSSLRVIIVRHPFTRILSAYRDKMLKVDPHPKEYHYRDLQLQIIAKYRPVDSPESSMFPTFSEFVEYILDSTKTLVTAMDWRKNVHCWTPYWAQCNVCGADYNVIIKLETMTEDERFLITLSNLEELRELKSQEWRHLNNTTSSDIAPEFYSQLSRTQIKQLYQRYLLDFLLFDYDIDDIYKGNHEE
ncbi:carbohydrate sulfotransferase 11-like [Palaemon carinicauda]|uniref:carbohydrate sulfotransferase 11-like n=1 Tax=Palaemon carinicauda TaxID=392227 RepID=UPI0035B59BD2